MAVRRSVTISGPAGVRLFGGRLAPAVLSGNLATGDAVASGSLASASPPPVLSGNITTADAAPSGALGGGSAPGFEAADAPATLLNETAASGVRFSGGMAFRQGDVPAGQHLRCTSLAAFQGVVLNRWPDGSVKYAVVAGQGTVAPATSAAIAISGTATSPGAPMAESVLIAAAPQAVIGFSGIGTVALASLLGVESVLSGGRYTAGRVRTLWEGPLCSSWLYYSRIAGHEHLAAWFEVRCWADGVFEVLPWIENGWWNVAGPTSYAGTASFTLGGAEVFSSAVTLHHHTRLPLLPSDAEPYRVGGNWATLLHVPAYLQATELVPSYYTAASEATIAGQVSTYVPMARASVPDPMGAGGYSPSIGLLPEWDVCYVTTADKRARKTVLINAWSHGRWPIHYRDETTMRTPLYAAYPTRVINTNAVGSVSSVGASSTNDRTPATSGATPPIHASSHHPSVGYLAYLISGWGYCIEEMQHLANSIHFKNGNLPRQNAKGIFLPSAGENTPRGMAWAWRTLAQTVTLTPDADPMRANFAGALVENINYYHATYVAQPNNPFGLLAPYGDAYTPAVTGTTLAGSTPTVILLDGSAHTVPEGRYNGWNLTIGGQTRVVTLYEASLRRATVGVAFTVPTESVAYRVGDDIMKVPIWQEDFITGAVGYSLALGIALGAAEQTRLEDFFHWKARSVTGRFGAPGVARTFHYADAAQYELAAAPSDTPDFVGGTGPWYANWGAIYQATLGITNVASPTDQLRGDSAMSFPSATGYWANLLPALSYAVRHHCVDADVALLRMERDPNWATFLGQLATAPVWGVVPVVPRMPSWMPALGTVGDFTVNTISQIDPGNGLSREGDWTMQGASALYTAWCGMHWNDWTSRSFYMGNGHADGCHNDVYSCDVMARTFSIVKPRAPWSMVPAVLGMRTWSTGSTASVVILEARFTSAEDGAYTGWTLRIGGEARTITGYVGATRAATVDTPFTVPTNDAAYTLTQGGSTLGVPVGAGSTTTVVVVGPISDPGRSIPNNDFTWSATNGAYYGSKLRIGNEVRNVSTSNSAARTLTLSSPLSAPPAEGAAMQIEFTSGWVADMVTGWHWSSKRGVEVDVGEPFGAHTYGEQLCLPGDALPGGDRRGWLITVGSHTMPIAANRATKQPLVYQPGNAKWAAFGQQMPEAPNRGPTFYDRARNRVISYTNANNRTKHFLDLDTGNTGSFNIDPIGTSIYGESAMGGYFEAEDLYMVLRIPDSVNTSLGPFLFSVVDPRNNTVLPVTLAGTQPPPNNSSGRHYACRWYEPWRSWICYQSSGGQTLHLLVAPANPRASNTWTWVERVVSGSPRTTCLLYTSRRG